MNQGLVVKVPNKPIQLPGPVLTAREEKLVENMIQEIKEMISDTNAKVNAIWDKQNLHQPHMDSLIGPPSLETRLKEYVDKRDEHKQNSLEQLIVDGNKILELKAENTALKLETRISKISSRAMRTEKTRAENHEDEQDFQDRSNKRFDRLEKVMYMGLGALGAIELVLKFLFK